MQTDTELTELTQTDTAMSSLEGGGASRGNTRRDAPWLVAIRESAPGDEIADRLTDRWVELACRHSRIRQVDKKIWVADVVGLEGAWSDGPSAQVAEANLKSVLHDWVTMKLSDGDRDLPHMHGLKLVIDE